MRSSARGLISAFLPAPGQGPAFLNDSAGVVRWGRVLAILLPLLLYAGSLGNDFLVDDEAIITANVRLAPGQTPLEIFRRPEQKADFTLPYYRPLTNLSYWVDARLWGLEPGGFHLTNWLLHATNTLLTFEFIRGLTGNPTVGLVAAILFAAHPIHSESVDLVQGRTDLLATLFFLVSLLALRRCLLARRTRQATVAGAASLLGFMGALLAKEMAITWPILVAGLFWADPESARGRLGRGGLMLAVGIGVLAGYLKIRQTVLGEIIRGDLGGLATPRLGLVPISLANYVRLLVWPFSFAFIREIPAPDAWTEPRVLGAGFLMVAMLGGLAILWRWNRLAAFGAGWTLATMLPVLNLIRIPGGFVVAERYLYLPSVGFCLLVAVLFRRALLAWPTRAIQVPLLSAFATVLIGFVATIQIRTAEWQDPIGTYEAMALQAPKSFFVRTNLGLEYLFHGRIADAVSALGRARDLEPTNPVAWNNLGAALEKSGRIQEAREAFERAITLDAGYAKPYENLARILSALGDRTGAEAASRRAQELTRWAGR